jgi:transcription termination/antitermination protein NusG
MRVTDGAIDKDVDPFAAEALDLWFVLRTKSRQEKILAGELSARGIRSFLPLMNCTRYYGGRKMQVELPVFPGYLFLRGEVDDAYEADRTRRVAQIIKVVDQTRLDQELCNLRLALQGSAPLDPYPYLRAGVRVEVRAGPFRGLQGVVEPGGRRNRLVLQVEILGRAVSLEIDPSLLDVIDQRA